MILKNGWYISSFSLYTQTHTLIHWIAGAAAKRDFPDLSLMQKTGLLHSHRKHQLEEIAHAVNSS